MALELATVPELLTMLPLEQDEQNKVLTFLNTHTIFAGQAAVKLFPEKVSQDLLEHTLLAQAVIKAKAAETDLQTIAAHGKQDLPKWPLKPAWGNNDNGVDAATDNATITDGVSAAANMAANMTLLTNDKPALAHNKTIQAGVKAASSLAIGIADTIEISLTGGTQANELMAQAKEGLRETVKQSGVELKDDKGQPIELDTFIKERFKQVKAGVDLRLLAKGVSALQGLDIGTEGHDRDGPYVINAVGRRDPLHDGKIGTMEMALTISDTTPDGRSLKPERREEAAHMRGMMIKALDLNGDGKASLEEIRKIAKTAGIQVDEQALQQTLESGRLPKPETPAVSNQPTDRGPSR